MRGPEPLQVVIQVRQINQIQRWMKLAINPLRRFGNPPRRGIRRTSRRVHSCGWSPKAWKWKFAEIAFDFVAHGVWPGIDVEDFPAIRRIHRARRDGPI